MRSALILRLSTYAVNEKGSSEFFCESSETGRLSVQQQCNFTTVYMHSLAEMIDGQ